MIRDQGVAGGPPSSGSSSPRTRDGYQFTLDPAERLWRKNLREQNGTPGIQAGDGVDPNRNFASRWGYDNEGSSPDKADETYRGPSAASEPETRFMQGLIDKIKPKFQSNFHPSTVAPLSAGLAGRDTRCRQPDLRGARPPRFQARILGFNPGQSADTLYVTNGETTDYADTQPGLSRTPRSSARNAGVGVRVPGLRESSRRSSEKTFSVCPSLAPGGAPGHPTWPMGIKAELFYLDQDEIDPQNGQQSLFDFVQRLPWRPAGGAGAREEEPGRRDPELPGERRSRADRADRRVGPAVTATAPAIRTTTT